MKRRRLHIRLKGGVAARLVEARPIHPPTSLTGTANSHSGKSAAGHMSRDPSATGRQDYSEPIRFRPRRSW